MRFLFLLAPICLASSLYADVNSREIARDLEAHVHYYGNPHASKGFELSNCELRLTTTVPNYSKCATKPVTSRVIVNHVDLREVARLDVTEHRGLTVVRLNLGVETLGPLTTLFIRLTKGEEKARKEWMDYYSQSLEQTEFNSFQSFQECGAESDKMPMRPSFSFLFDEEPKTLDSLVSYLEQCRARIGLSVKVNRK